MTMKTRYLSRRTFLRGCAGGVAVSLALPPLEAMLDVNGAWADGHGEDPFFGVFYWANGMPWHAGHGPQQGMRGHPDLWTPAATGADYAPSQLLSPLARHRVSVITGLEPHTQVPPSPPGQSDGHMRGFMVSLTGDRIRPEGFNHGSHTLTALRASMDQFVAKHPSFYRQPIPFRSLELGVSTARFHNYGHWNAISYNGPDSTNLPIMEPSQLYDRLFSVPPDADASRRRSRLLDAVLEDAQSLRARLGVRDRRRLESHLDGINALQQRIDAANPQCDAPPRPSDQGDLIEKTRTMAQLLAVAVDCRLTRVFSFMLTSPATTHVFSNLNVPDGMHKTCHDGHWERVRDITRYQMEAFSVFLDALSTPRPGGGTLLDQGCVYGTSEYGEGWQHGVKEMPVVLAGRASGALNPNVHVRLPAGNLARAQLTALKAVGLDIDQFGWNGAETGDPFGELLT